MAKTPAPAVWQLPVCRASMWTAPWDACLPMTSAFLHSASPDPLCFSCPGSELIPAGVPRSLRSSSLVRLPSSSPLLLWSIFKGWFSIGSSCLLFALLEVGSLEELGRGRKRKQGCLSALPRPCLQATASLLCWTRSPRIAKSRAHPYLHLSNSVLSKQEIELPFCLAA